MVMALLHTIDAIMIAHIFQTPSLRHCDISHAYCRWRRDSTHIPDTISITPLFIRIEDWQSYKVRGAGARGIVTLNLIRILIFYY